MRLRWINFTIIYSIIAFVRFCRAHDSCINKDNDKCRNPLENKYSKEANDKFEKYLNYIKEAEANYIPCNKSDCRCYSFIIKNDLKVFEGRKISPKDLDNVAAKGTKYQIINHKLYRDPNCMFPARCSGVEYFLLKLLPNLPDMEFVLNSRDWPQIHKQYGAFGPVFSFSKDQNYLDIMYPAWAFWGGGPAISLYPKGIGRWDLIREDLAKVGNKTSWEEKQTMAFFRGSRTSSERDALILLSREKPDLIDAQYTKNQAWKSDADTLYAPPAKEVSFKEHCRYKYLFNFRGVAASFRFKHALLCKSLVFHVGDEWVEFFYPLMKPWIHYIPVEANSNKRQLEELIEFAIHHDDIAKQIAENGYNFIWNHLRMEDVLCYWKNLLKRYAKLLTYEPQRNNKFIEIKA